MEKFHGTSHCLKKTIGRRRCFGLTRPKLNFYDYVCYVWGKIKHKHTNPTVAKIVTASCCGEALLQQWQWIWPMLKEGSIELNPGKKIVYTFSTSNLTELKKKKNPKRLADVMQQEMFLELLNLED